jgi:disulfide bond formation protein DsbB
VIGAALAVAGAAAGGYQVWLQSDPVRASKCVGSPVERILDATGIGGWAPPLLQYDGPCTLAPWSLFGLSIPEWSLIWFVILVVMFAATPWLSNR